MAAEDLLNKMEQFVNPGLARVQRFMGLHAVEATGRGALLFDEEGQRYIDCAGGYGAMLHGYGHPKILEAARRQLDRLALSSRVLINRPMVELAESLATLTPGDLQYSFFCNSGTEAVEAAIKFARATTGRPTIIATYGGFHGKTMGSLSVSGRRLYQDPFEPLLPGVKHVEYGNLGQAEQALDTTVAAMIVEPIQGEGGIIVPPDDYLPGLRRACDRAGALLIADEVQTGIGRTGKLFAVQHSGVVPDLLCLAKALGGGVVPIGAVVGRPSAWEFFTTSPLIHSSTFGGNELACAVAQAALQVTVEERLAERAERMGIMLIRQLTAIQAQYPAVIRQIRGRGLMVGMEMVSAGASGALIAELFRRRVLAVYTLNNDRVIRLIPPLVITEEELDEALAAIRDSIHAVNQYLDDLEA